MFSILKTLQVLYFSKNPTVKLSHPQKGQIIKKGNYIVQL